VQSCSPPGIEFETSIIPLFVCPLGGAKAHAGDFTNGCTD